MSFVCDDHEFSCRINDEASICTAELLAIEAAIEYIWDSSDEEFMIITDSLSSLQALKSQKLNNPIVSNILHMCHYLSGHKDIVFCWLPSHIGIQGNERADVLAKAALDKTKQFYYIPYTDFKYNISTLMTFCKVNGTSMSPANCSRYNQSLKNHSASKHACLGRSSVGQQ